MTINDDQLERLFTKLGEMHADVRILKQQHRDAAEERNKFRKDISALKRCQAKNVGYILGAGAVLSVLSYLF